MREDGSRNDGTEENVAQLTGMTCAACANRIEKGLSKMEGVQEANVNFALEKASVTFDPNVVSVQQMEEKLKSGLRKGNRGPALIGMYCAACATKIEKVVSKMPGVNQANVNFALETARVEFNPAEVSLSDIQQRVEKLGYQAVSKQETLDQEGHRKEAITKAIFLSAILSAALGHGEPFLLHLLDLDAGPVHEPLVPADPGHTGTVFIGKQFYVGAYKALRNKSANMDVLVALGTSATYFYSLYLTIDWAAGANAHHGPEMYYETSAVLITLVIMGKLFESWPKAVPRRPSKP